MGNGEGHDIAAHVLERDRDIRRRGEQQRELLPAIAGQHVIRAMHGGGEGACHLAQGVVAGAMPVMVVELLEVVDVDHRDAQGFPGAHRVTDGLVVHPVEVTPIGDAGELVAYGQVRQLLPLRGQLDLIEDAGVGNGAVDRLLHIVDGTGPQCPLLGFLGGLSRNEHNGNAGGTFICTQQPQNLIAVDVRHGDVQQYQADPGCIHSALQGAFAVLGEQDLAIAAHQLCQQHAAVGVIVDNQ